MARKQRRGWRAVAVAAALITGTTGWTAVAQESGPAPCRAAECGERLVYFGTHGDAIIAARFDDGNGRLRSIGPVAAVQRPSWLVANPRRPVVYAVSESAKDSAGEAQVYALAADRRTGGLRVLDSVSSAGGGATHLSFDPRSQTVFVANYGTGHVAALPVLADGRLATAASVRQDQGSGPSPRQKGPHAHSVLLDPSGRWLIVGDLGADRVFVYRFDPRTRALAPGGPPFVQAAPGSGPRHAAFAGGGRFLYVANELSGDVTGYAWDGRGGRLRALQTVPAVPADAAGPRSVGEIAAAPDGRFLYVSTRGNDNALVVFAVDRASGALRQVQRIAAGGTTPWSFALAPGGRWLLVANQGSDRVSVFRVDPARGTLEATAEGLDVPKPVNVTFLDPP